MYNINSKAIHYYFCTLFPPKDEQHRSKHVMYMIFNITPKTDVLIVQNKVNIILLIMYLYPLRGNIPYTGNNDKNYNISVPKEDLWPIYSSLHSRQEAFAKGSGLRKEQHKISYRNVLREIRRRDHSLSDI